MHNIAATRAGVRRSTRVEERELSGDALLTRDDIDRNAATLANVPLWDHQPLLDTFGQIQEIRTYYDFVSVDNDRYVIDGEYRADDAVGARAQLREPAEPHLDQRAAHVHPRLRPHAGAGEPGHARRSARAVHQEPAAGVHGGHEGHRAEHLLRRAVQRPRVRPHAHASEFHYPRGDDNVTTTYAGDGGVPAQLLLRASCSSRSGSGPQDRAVQREHHGGEPGAVPPPDAGARAQIAPFLTFESDPLPRRSPTAGSSGSRTPTRRAHRYPYSTPTRDGGVNYIRNSVKAAVDAYNGHDRRSIWSTRRPDRAHARRRCSRVCSARSRDMPEGLRRGCATRRASSSSRSRCTRRIT